MAPQREWLEKDYYAVLGVAADADQKAVTKAYRGLARKLHPDANPGDAAAEERFKEVSSAYDVIGDPEKRKEYDEVRTLAARGGGFGPGGFGPGGFGGGETVDMGDLGSLFGGLFNRGGGRGSGGRSGPAGRRARRGADLETELHLSFEDAVDGVTTSVRILADAVCSTCHGDGARPGTAPKVCPQCAGQGVVADDQGPFSFSTPCPRCGGRGSVIEDPCPTCAGSGIERRPREVKVRIPAGVVDGTRIRVKGRGAPGRDGGAAGDLFVVCRVTPHDLFRVKGTNLALTVPVTFPEAVLGADIAVPTLHGGTVTVRIPAGTPTGRTFRVKGRGVPAKAGPGDLLVTVEVAVPTKLTAAQRKVVEELATLTADESPRAHLFPASMGEQRGEQPEGVPTS
ncbi:MAG TPA: molecular chaperone DnaJ [Iamia sp.]|jgi:molecular chaperone DnaJ|nr:molecular chaperone DnaJ [Iamia sp.]